MRRNLKEDERGVSAVLVVVCLMALFGTAMLSIDFGNMYQTRRNIVTGTDASALQEAGLASTAVASPTACSTDWTNAISRNAGTVSPLGCAVTVTHTTDAGVPITGYVAVDARKLSQTRFGGVVGVGNSSPYSLSVAQWGPPSGVTGLRPFGLCDEDPHYTEWLAYAARGYPMAASDPYNMLRGTTDHPAITGAGVVHRIFVDNDGSTCGQAPGNWGWLDYDSSSNPTGAQRNWWSNGYTQLVNMHSGANCTDPEAADGNPSDGCVPGNTGNRGTSFDNELDGLEITGEAVPIMIFSHLTGNGQNSIYQAVGFLSVIIRDFDVHGSVHYMDLEFVRHEWGGTCCALSSAPDNGTRVVIMCAIDHDVTGASIGTRCS